MPEQTLEQELAAFVAGSDYRVRIHSGTYWWVTVIYVPSIRAVDVGGAVPLAIHDGAIASRNFGRWRRWPRARKFVEQTVAGHRALLETGVLHR